MVAGLGVPVFRVFTVGTLSGEATCIFVFVSDLFGVNS